MAPCPAYPCEAGAARGRGTQRDGHSEVCRKSEGQRDHGGEPTRFFGGACGALAAGCGAKSATFVVCLWRQVTRLNAGARGNASYPGSIRKP